MLLKNDMQFLWLKMMLLYNIRFLYYIEFKNITLQMSKDLAKPKQCK